MQDAPAQTSLPPAQFRAVLAALLLAVFLAALDGTIVAVALPTIVGDLGGVEDTSWVVTAYLLTATASIPLYGRISDVYGRKPTLIAAVLIFLTGSALCGAAQGIAELAAARSIQGVGGGGLLALALAVVADLVPSRARARYQGLFGAVFGVASIIGPLTGGLIVDNTSWRWIFYLNLPIGLVVLAVLATRLDLPTRRREHPLDLVGAVLLVLGVGAFLSWVSQGQQVGFGDPRSWVPGGTAALALLAFGANERRAAEPILPPRLFRIRAFALTAAVSFLAGVALFTTVVFVPLTLQVVQQRSATASGLILVALTAGMVVTSTGAGRTVARTGRFKAFPVVGTALITAALFGLTQVGPQTSVATLVAVLVVLGLGTGMVSQMLVLVAQSAVNAREIGVATASVSFFRTLGGTVGTAIGAATLAAVLSHRLDESSAAVDAEEISLLPDVVAALPPGDRAAYVAAFTDAAQAVFWVAAPLMAVAFVLALLIPPISLDAADLTGNQDPADRDPADQDSSGDQYASPASTNAAAPTSPAS